MSDLNDYLRNIDSIEDDEEFCNEEYRAVKRYCYEKCFELDKNDISIIKGRGLYDAYEIWKEDFNTDYLYNSDIIKKVNECLRKYESGEIFFNKLDEMMKFDEKIMESFIEKVTWETSIDVITIASGEFGLCLHNYELPVTILVQGGLRNGNKIMDLSKFVRPGKKHIFLDDSYFSGKTAKVIKEEVERCGGIFAGTYVIYDGSKYKDPTVKSMYRYYDNFPAEREYHVKLLMSEEYNIKAKSPAEARNMAIDKFGSDYYVDSVEVTEIKRE